MLDSVSLMIQKRWKNVMGQINDAKAKAQEQQRSDLRKTFFKEIQFTRVEIPESMVMSFEEGEQHQAQEHKVAVKNLKQMRRQRQQLEDQKNKQHKAE